MAGDTSNGQVAQALVAALKEEFKEHRREVMEILQPLARQVAAHEEMSKSHCHELYNEKGSRVREIELALEAQVQALHIHEVAATEEAKTGVSRSWAVKMVLITASSTLVTSLAAQYLITHYIAH